MGFSLLFVLFVFEDFSTRHNSSLVCMVEITYVCTLTRYLRFIGTFFFNPSLLLSWMFGYDCLDTCCFGCLICMRFLFLYLHLFSAIEHVSHGKVL